MFRESMSHIRIIFDDRPGTGMEPVYDWLTQRGWTWGIQCKTDVSGDAMSRLVAHGLRAGVVFPAHPETQRRQWSDWKQRLPPIDEVLDKAVRASGGHPSEVVWEVLVEEDSAGVAFPQKVLAVKPGTHSEARALLDQRLREVMEIARPWRERGVRIWGLCGFASSAHAYAANGVECVIAERANDDIDDLQTGIAFCRGAARQYRREWGIDLSFWWGPVFGCVAHLPAGYHKRHLYLTYFSGADVLRLEGSDFCWDNANSRPSAFGRLLDEFGDFTKRLDRGVPETPVAVMLPDDHGWISPGAYRTTNEAWNYARIPYRQGDRGIDGLFGTAFPGSEYAMQPYPFGSYTSTETPASPFALACVTPEFCCDPSDVWEAEPPIPFGRYASRDEARRVFADKGIDPSPYRPMGTSRWGDIIDVLTTDTTDDVLQRYPVLVLAGPVRCSDALLTRLRAYVSAGGTLVWSSGVARPEHGDLTGVEMTPELRIGHAWRWGVAAPVVETFQYTPLRSASKDTETLASTPSGEPLAVCHRLGRGAVYTCALPWFSAGQLPLAGLALKLLDSVIAPVQPMTVSGLPVEWLSTAGDGHRTVILANNDGAPWSGTVTVRDLAEDLTRCDELTAGCPLQFVRTGAAASVSLTVPPYDVAVIRWQR